MFPGTEIISMASEVWDLVFYTQCTPSGFWEQTKHCLIGRTHRINNRNAMPHATSKQGRRRRFYCDAKL